MMKRVESDYKLFEEYLKISFGENMPQTDEELFFMYVGIGLVRFTRMIMETPGIIKDTSLKEIIRMSSRLESTILNRKKELIRFYKICIEEYICDIKGFDRCKSKEFVNWYKNMMSFYEEKSSEWSEKIKDEALKILSTIEKILFKEFFDISINFD